MNTQLRFEKKNFKGANLNGTSTLPCIRAHPPWNVSFKLDEDDGLLLGYGKIPNYQPYTFQDLYDRAEEPLSWDSAVLENDYLRATFVPQTGGRMWSLYDKVRGEDLITNNPVFRPGNLASRDAWICGGIEYNCGTLGHSVLTLEPLHTARLTLPDGTPVLRFYEFERIRAITYQMDFFLPADSCFVFARMRIYNHHKQVTPIYWWTTVAVPERPGYRVVVPADMSYASAYVSETERGIGDVAIPYGHGFDCTYPTNNPRANDYFFNIPQLSRKYETQVGPDGWGMIHASTNRLQGRKLFIFGQNVGGHNWQRSLTNEEGENYQEMQAGLAQTQAESLPIPPTTAWEWCEAYGAIQVDGGKVHGDWAQARETVEAWLEEQLPLAVLDNYVIEGKKTFGKVAGEVVREAHKWGALENYRLQLAGEEPMDAHLDYGEMGPEQAPWKHLLDTGSLPTVDPADPPVSYMIQEPYFVLLEQAVRGPDAGNWFSWYQLALNYYNRECFADALSTVNRSLTLAPSVWGYHCLANVHRMLGNLPLACITMRRALSMRPCDVSLVKEILRLFTETKDYKGVKAIYAELHEDIKPIPQVQFLLANALARSGDIAAAEAILYKDGGMVIPDLREGEASLTDLLFFIAQQKAAAEGRTVTLEEIDIPKILDFRMTALTTMEE